ncbi:MarR family transcriptional regulator [Nitratireductor sp. GISD-1A_MAKvit]|uniref:MarR family transcriptional regulator n=1 Tax=Nitratireductor sp. GISD-1A_MAKvit TaxID=3234198 RepID=UPI00346765BC
MYVHSNRSTHVSRGSQFSLAMQSVKKQAADGNSSTVALYNGLELVRILSVEGPMNAEELAQRLSMRGETTAKLLKTLELHGFVERSRFADRFQPGRIAGTLSEKFLSDSPLHGIARPVLKALADRHHATTALAVTHDRKALFLLVCNGLKRSTPPPLRAGSACPLAETAAGHALLLTARAELEAEDLESEHGSLDMERLEASFRHFREHGCFRLELPMNELLRLGAPLQLNNTVMAVEIVLPRESAPQGLARDLLASVEIIQRKCADAGLVYLEDA